MVEGGQYTFFVRIQQSVPVPRVHPAHLINVLKHCHKRAGAAAGRVRQLDLPIHDRKHRLDTQGTAYQRHRGGQTPALVQVLQAVHYGQNADALLELFQLSGNRVRGQVLLVAQAQRFANQDALALGCRAGIHKKDILKIAAFRCQPCALIGAGQVRTDQNGNYLIAVLLGILKNCHKGLGAGLAGAGGNLVHFQMCLKFISRQLHTVQPAGAIGKGNGQGHSVHAGTGTVGRGQIGSGISQNTNHAEKPLSVRQRPAAKNSAGMQHDWVVSNCEYT